MRAMHFDDLEPNFRGPPRSSRKILDNLRDLASLQGVRRGPPVTDRVRGWSDRFPCISMVRRQGRPAAEGRFRRTLTAGMGDLHTGHAAHFFDEAHCRTDRFRLFIGPDTKAGGCDAPARLDSRRLGEDQSRLPPCERAEMREKPIARQAVCGGVHAERRDSDPVGQCHAAQFERREKQRFFCHG